MKVVTFGRIEDEVRYFLGSMELAHGWRCPEESEAAMRTWPFSSVSVARSRALSSLTP